MWYHTNSVVHLIILSLKESFKAALERIAGFKSKTTEDIINIGSFMEVLILIQYVLVRKIFKKVLDSAYAYMVCDITNEEIKLAMFGIREDRSPGPDGKILTNWIIEGIKEVVIDNQSAFVPGRRISDNIIITEERFETRRCPFSLSFHAGYGDDLFIFARGDVESTRLIMDALDEFKMTSRLVPNIHKSNAYFCNVRNHVKISIIMPFAERELPITYLGVPLISSRLLNKDCKILVEKAKNRIRLHHVLVLDDPRLDLTKWHDLNGNMTHFSFLKAWEALRPWGNESYVRSLADMELVPPYMHDILMYLQPIANKQTVRRIFGILLLAATSYLICIERNNRIFKKVRRPPEELRDCIMVKTYSKVPAIFFPPCKPSRSETKMFQSSVKEIDNVQLRIVNQAELKLFT
ncbi:hypothetical protein Tco_0216368 [Tanacetum coccineum]